MDSLLGYMHCKLVLFLCIFSYFSLLSALCLQSKIPGPLFVLLSSPKIVYVLPDPVCPYANTVALDPSMMLSINRLPTSLNMRMHCCVDDGSKM